MPWRLGRDGETKTFTAPLLLAGTTRAPCVSDSTVLNLLPEASCLDRIHPEYLVTISGMAA